MIENNKEPVFYLRGQIIRQRSTETKNANGTSSRSLDVPVCEVSEWFDPEDVLAIFNYPRIAAGEVKGDE